MADLKTTRQSSPIAYSCYFARNREGEQFTSEHVLSYQIAGALKLTNGIWEYVFEEGDFRFIRRNQLVKFIKEPATEGVFKSVSIFLDQAMLKSFSLEYGYKAENRKGEAEPVLRLQKRPIYQSYMNSLLPHVQGDQLINQPLETLKQREAVMILLQSEPEMKDILFDFSEPGKLDLEAFMNKNFHFNVQLERFAYLTGRSLSTFKRDFEKIFGETPSRWLLKRRLKEAYYLMKEKGKSASEVYLDLGFEDLSHFSFSFKKQFGISPSRI
jgi:AraC family transcriptional regulator, exoenzyme S synthesis regulatory protein ExsA